MLLCSMLVPSNLSGLTANRSAFFTTARIAEGVVMRSMLKAVAVGLAVVVLAVPTGATAFTIFSDSGANAAAITGTVDAFRAALGDPNNGNAGPQGTGRREINW